MTQKVFCIGFHKTGTKSLAAALRTLGYRVTGPNGVRDPEIATNVYDMAAKLVTQYDAFQDNPWPIIYREMDERHPGSKFILVLRDTQAWIDSQVKHFGTEETPMRKWIYGVGCPKGNEEVYLARYARHNREVQEYFASRPDDLLVMKLESGAAWEPICRFLGKKVPDLPYPRENTSQQRDQWRETGKGPAPAHGFVNTGARTPSSALAKLRRLFGLGR